MANTIKIGNLEIDNLKVGTLSVDALYIGDVKIYPPTPPTPTGTCYEVISTPIASYTATTYDSVFTYNDVKWYMKNNLNQYEEYGIYDSANTLSSLTYYEGKLAVIGETEYQYSGGSWVVVGSYVDSSVTYTIDDTNPSPYVGQELPTTFKIPYADVESIGFVDFSIRDNNDDRLQIMLDTGGMAEYNYRDSEWNEYRGEITEDGEYFYLSLPSEAPQSIVINEINYRNSEPIHLIAGSKQVTVEYEEKDIPLAKTYSSVADMELDACPSVGVGQYGLVGNDLYQFNDNEEWDTVSSSSVKFIGKYGSLANVYECSSTSAITTNQTKPSYISSGITSAVVGNCVTSIGSSAFYQTNTLTSITLSNSVTSIGTSAFYGCNGLTNITLPSGLTDINYEAFCNCRHLTSIDIPNSVTTIGQQAFQLCYALTSVTIGSGVTMIQNNAFAACTSLTSITINATTPPSLPYANAFSNTNNCPIYVPCGSVDAYKAASGWSSLASRITCVQPKTLQWVTYNNGDTIPSDLDIYGFSGAAYVLGNSLTYDVNDKIRITPDKNRVYIEINCNNANCYNNEVTSNTNVQLIFSNIGCCDYYNFNSAVRGGTLQLYIYA